MKRWHFGLLAAVIGLDQLTKFAVEANLDLYESIPVIDRFCSITYTRNTGAAWSLLEGKMLFFYGIAVVALIAMGCFYKQCREKDHLTRIGLVLMMAGTIGNLIDRLAWQYVRDFLDFVIFGYDFPVFNVADMALCIGVLLILIEIGREELEKRGMIGVKRNGA